MEKYMERLGCLHKVLFVTCEEKCYRFSSVRCREVPELECVQEEADGRLLLHAAHAAEGDFEAVVISSNDTDVLLQCYQSTDVPEEWNRHPNTADRYRQSRSLSGTFCMHCSTRNACIHGL